MRSHGSLSRVRIPIIVIASILITSSICRADSEFERRSLRGLSGVYVLVEELDDQAKRDGVGKEDIQTDVELKLRLASIKVVTEKESMDVPGSPYLYVNLNAKLRDGLYAYSIEVSLAQNVLLERNQSRTSATTWSAGSVGTVGQNKLRQVRDIIKDEIDTFINAYLSVNPKK